MATLSELSPAELAWLEDLDAALDHWYREPEDERLDINELINALGIAFGPGVPPAPAP